MKTIWKFLLVATPSMQIINPPFGVKFLSAGLDPSGDLCVWGEVESGNSSEPRQIWVFGTGLPIPDYKVGAFIGTVRNGQFMWHVFDGGRPD